MDTSVLGLVAHSCPTLCDPMDCSPPGSVHGILRQEHRSGWPCPPLMSLLANGRVSGQKIAMILLTSPHFLLVTRVGILHVHPETSVLKATPPPPAGCSLAHL